MYKENALSLYYHSIPFFTDKSISRKFFKYMDKSKCKTDNYKHDDGYVN